MLRQQQLAFRGSSHWYMPQTCALSGISAVDQLLGTHSHVYVNTWYQDRLLKSRLVSWTDIHPLSRTSQQDTCIHECTQANFHQRHFDSITCSKNSCSEFSRCSYDSSTNLDLTLIHIQTKIFQLKPTFSEVIFQQCLDKASECRWTVQAWILNPFRELLRCNNVNQ